MDPTDDGDEVLAPMAAMASDAVEEDEDLEPESDDGGFSDAEHIVRVWITDDRLSRVRVSTRWREKLESRPLGDCFTQALMLANLRLADIPKWVEPTYEHLDFSQLPPLGPVSLMAFERRFEEVEARWEATRRRQQERQPLESPATFAKSKGVTVELNASGRPSKVLFDVKWLERAELVSIRTHVIRACDRARARIVPSVDEGSELASIESEHHLLLTAFRAMLNPREKS